MRYVKVFVAVATALVLFISCEGPVESTQLIVNTDDCTGCGKCVEVCPYNAIEVIDGDAVIDPSLCHFCYRCVEECPEGAIY
ncbi:MAG: 4Fe-4S binding protein [Candidatus Aegiribacteria sp.]|nr:4Fe-4S binding protein [Candidatus Aegiribacteria sp.]